MLTRRSFLEAAALQAMPSTRKPNIVIVLADDLGYGELGFQGNPEIPTPHIDSIARNGVRFTQGYVSAPYCCPSRAGLMTGRYQTRFGHEMNAVGRTNLDPKVGLPVDEKTMGDYLRSRGYRTALIGKWHLGATADYHPQRRGFDEFYGFLHEGHFYFPPPYRGALTRLRKNEPPYDEENPILRGTDPVVETEYLTDALAREAVSFIGRNQDSPFFLYLAFNAIHSPMQAPVDRLSEFESIRSGQRRLFAAMLRSMDDAVGSLLAKLQQLNLERDTLIFFLSDNGGPTAELTSSNKPLRGGKGQLWEGGIRVPFAAQWKGRIPAGQVFQHPVISLDILPTALAAAEAPSPASIDGVNLLPMLRSKATEAAHSRLFWRYGKNIALRRGPWKLVRQGSEEFQLFHVERDMAEARNVSVENPEIAASLKDDVETLDRQMVPPRWGAR